MTIGTWASSTVFVPKVTSWSKWLLKFQPLSLYSASLILFSEKFSFHSCKMAATYSGLIFPKLQVQWKRARASPLEISAKLCLCPIDLDWITCPWKCGCPGNPGKCDVLTALALDTDPTLGWECGWCELQREIPFNALLREGQMDAGQDKWMLVRTDHKCPQGIFHSFQISTMRLSKATLLGQVPTQLMEWGFRPYPVTAKCFHFLLCCFNRLKAQVYHHGVEWGGKCSRKKWVNEP